MKAGRVDVLAVNGIVLSQGEWYLPWSYDDGVGKDNDVRVEVDREDGMEMEGGAGEQDCACTDTRDF
jgi:hypothetical protein